ncbi:hypothetical protein ED733_002543 [Metarhizium rileyi]|uniref:Methyltransferase type 11 domain-containing protein n=1 Tax=Metarhizium rileyi (strain RCEF 4871) TaxID=1649241 RepID=A0A5C6GDU6_METRR|nr:hypothetical protein ED733_002543 [Metarhizium rileyi]
MSRPIISDTAFDPVIASHQQQQAGLFLVQRSLIGGTWLCDVGTMLPPETRLVGFDIAPELYPPSHLLPSNVQLVPGDLLTSLPDSWTRNFDLVHQRFVFPGIPSEAFHDALCKLMECVKPGGWIQLVEPLAGENVSGPGPSAFAVLHRLANKFMKSSNIEQRITSRLQEGGFININVQMMDIVLGKSQQNKELDVRGRKTMRAALVNMSSMTNAKEMGMSDEEWGSLMERFDRDMMTFCIAVRHVIIWAQRPE